MIAIIGAWGDADLPHRFAIATQVMCWSNFQGDFLPVAPDYKVDQTAFGSPYDLDQLWPSYDRLAIYRGDSVSRSHARFFSGKADGNLICYRRHGRISENIRGVGFA